MLTSLLLANLLHGLVAWLWLGGVLRFAKPFQPADQARLHALAVGLPVVVAGLQAVGENLARSPWPVVRVDRWAEWLARSPRLFVVALVLFLAGTAAIFLFQEVIPAWVRRRRHWRAPRGQDVRIDSGLARVRKRFAEHGHGWRRTPRAARLEASTPMAGLVGLAQPTVLVSRGLLDRIDDEQLDAVIAHELAHSFYGGNLMLLLLWLLRALQPLSPATLVLHRTFVQRHEEACDALAARVTGRPLALAEVLLLVAGSSGAQAQAQAQAQTQTMTDVTTSAAENPAQTADQASTRLRVRGLLDRDHQSTDAPSAFIGLLALALAGVLWSIG